MPAEGFAKHPQLIAFNNDLAQLIGLPPAAATDPDMVQFLSGNKPLPGGDPLAMVYAGHQFGVWVPQLGDGRALLLGQIKTKDSARFDIQLKGAGKTPYSRFADGRAVLRSTIREYLCSEMMAGLGIPTSRALAIVATGEQVVRERWEAGAILTRLATSHIRFGHVEFFCHNNQTANVKILLDHFIKYYAPEFCNSKKPYHDLLSWVVERTAALIAHWQAVGFCHGVMNTDNMSLVGETIDYGPFGFLEQYDPGHVCNHSDESGRYSFQNQPRVAWWNLYALGVAMRSLVPEEEASDIVKNFSDKFQHYFYKLMAQKFGFTQQPQKESLEALTINWLNLLEEQKKDYTASFTLLGTPLDQLAKDNLFLSDDGKKWLATYKTMIGDTPDATRRATMAEVNPFFVLRNWVAQVAIEEATKENYQPLHDILKLCQHPFHHSINTMPPLPTGAEKFCGPAPAGYQQLAVSCSS